MASPRKNFIEKATTKSVAALAYDAMQLASSHDPDLLLRIEVLERQMERLGAPQYRTIKKGFGNTSR